jgi:hypothetical protein
VRPPPVQSRAGLASILSAWLSAGGRPHDHGPGSNTIASIAVEASAAPLGTAKVRVPVAALAVKLALVTCAKAVDAGVKLPAPMPLNDTLTVAVPP